LESQLFALTGNVLTAGASEILGGLDYLAGEDAALKAAALH
jgi:hypothetical protein